MIWKRGYLNVSVRTSLPNSESNIRHFDIFLPKFNLESTFKLESLLLSLGMLFAVDKNTADFSGMDKGKCVYINEMYHKASVEVNEEGSDWEAAADTVVEMTIKSRKKQETPEFKANHPFLFFIRDALNDALFFFPVDSLNQWKRLGKTNSELDALIYLSFYREDIS